MSPRNFLFLLSAFVGLAVSAPSLLGWNIAEDYVVAFSTGSAKGTFSELDGTIVFDPTTPNEGEMDVSVRVETIDTGNKTKDKHARGDSWFDADQYPTIRFVSDNFTTVDGKYSVSGKLNLHGITKTVNIPFQFEEKSDGMGVFVGSFTLNRKDYGINGNAFGFMVGKEVTVDLRVPVSK